MKMRNIILGGAIVLAAAGCAKLVSTSSNEQTKLYIEAWLEKNHPDAKLEGNGIYTLEDTPGTGTQYNGETYVQVLYTASSMDGTISSTLDEKTAQQIGTYDPTAYYGGKMWYTADNAISVGLEDMLKGMTIGEVKTSLIPSWLNVTERKDSAEDYFKNTKDLGSTGIYKLTLLDFTNNVFQWEVNKIENHCIEKYGHKVDSLKNGFYYITTKAPSVDEAMPKDTSYYINYTGRLLNGQVFDTTIKDTAKKYNLYSSSSTYEPVKITMAEEITDIEMTINGSSSSDMVTGFQYILAELKPYEHATGIFVSDLGYGYSGTGSAIFPYTPLIFDIEVTDEP